MPTNNTYSLFRHGEAKWPEGMLAKSEQQRWDTHRPMTDLGREQVRKLLARLGSEDRDFNVVLHAGSARTEFLAVQLPRSDGNKQDSSLLPSVLTATTSLTDPPSNTIDYALVWQAYNLWGSKTSAWMADTRVADALANHANMAVGAVYAELSASEWNSQSAEVAIVGSGVYIVVLAMFLCQSRQHLHFLTGINMGCCDEIQINRFGFEESVTYFPLEGEPQIHTAHLERPPYL